jgi:amino acid adenylation domain-containing protein
LTQREAEVLDLLAHGLSNGQLAEQLGVTVHAVKFHLASIYRKLGVSNRTEAAGLYFQHLAPLPPSFAPPENGRRSPDEEARRERVLAAPPVLELPSPVRGERGAAGPARQEHGFGAELTAALRTMATREHARVESVVLAGLAAVLRRYTQVEDVVLGSDSGPLWLDTAGDPTFADLVRRVERELVHAPLDPAGGSGNGDARVEPGLWVSIACIGAAYDLTVVVEPLGDELVATASHDGARLERAAVARLLRGLVTLLAAGIRAPSTRLGALDLLTAEEQTQVLHEWNATARPYPRCRADELVARQAAERPGEVAVAFEDRRLTYAELDAQVNGLARVLQQLGVGPGVLVAVCIERSAEMLVALLGIMRAGGAYVPVDPAFPADRQRFMLEDASVGVIVTQESLLPKFARYGAQCLCLDRDGPRIAAAGGTAPPCAVGPDDLAYVMYTSGSTGRPKGVQIQHSALVNFLTTMADQPGLGADDVLVAVTTLSFDIAGLELYLPLAVGGRVVVATQEVSADPRALAALIDSAGATVVQATPTTWRMLVDSGWTGRRGLKALCGGEALPQILAEQLLERGLELWNMYGPTETTIWSTVSQVQSGEPLTIGRPIANTALYILDDELQPVPLGVPGELHIGGDGIARGYLNRPELTAERFVPNPFDARDDARIYKTGDLARYRDDGRVEFLGRRDHQVKVRGFRIELGEIETALARLPGVTAVVAVAREDSPGDARLVAYVVLDGSPPVTANALRRSLADVLPAYMVPSVVVALDELPLTPNGKIDRKALPEPTLEREAESTYSEPRTDLERRLVSIWEEELGIRPIGIDDDFFDLGLTSIVAARLFARLERDLGTSLPLGALFQAPTIQRLALVMNEERGGGRWTSLAPIQPDGTQPPFFCVHGGAGTILHLQPLARRLGPDQPFYGLQARGLYGGAPPHRSVEQMAKHYLDELRTVQPHGPYYLAGYCFGSIVAFDMAQRLLRAGEEVNVLAVFNGPSPSWIRRYGTIGGQTSMREAPVRPERSLPARVVAVLTNPTKIRRWSGHLAWRLEKAFVDPLRIRLAMRFDRPLNEEQREIFFLEIAGHAQTVYEPSRYPGPMVVFYGDGVYEDPALGWSGSAASVETYGIAGPHRGNRTLMAEPAVSQLAARMQEVLDRARRGDLRAQPSPPASPAPEAPGALES